MRCNIEMGMVSQDMGHDKTSQRAGPHLLAVTIGLSRQPELSADSYLYILMSEAAFILCI